MPDHGGNRTYDLWNTSPMLCQLTPTQQHRKHHGNYVAPDFMLLMLLLMIDNQRLDIVMSHKILGLTIQNDLKWGLHIDEIVGKVSKRLHIIRALRRAGVPAQELVHIYISLIRSILEYCWPVWHTSLPQYLSDDVEKIQKRAFRIICPALVYAEAMKQLGCSSLYERREVICMKTVEKIEQRDTPLSRLLPLTRESVHGRDLRNSKNRTSFLCRTNRYKSSFFPSLIDRLNYGGSEGT